MSINNGRGGIVNLLAQFLVFILSLGLSSSVFAANNCKRTLVISQIVDTLKLAHIQNFWDSLNYNTDTKQGFIGMNMALSQLAHKCPANVIVYLTQGSELLAGKAEREFIKNNHFPRGKFTTYSTVLSKEGRADILRNLIKGTDPGQVVLISHNGGVDSEVFHALAAEYKDLPFMQYFHLVYSTNSPSEVGRFLFSEQTGYVTAVELMVDWQLKGLTDFTETELITRSLIPRIVLEDPDASGISEYAVPRFVNCDDFQWRWSVENDYSFLAPLRTHLVDRCLTQVPLTGY
jgi:hypothetical protein